METQVQHISVEVRVVTTSGTYPTHGFEKTPSHQPVRQVLKEAVRELKIRDTQGWIALAIGREIDPDKSYEGNSLKGEVVIDYGPKEGGGGDA
jgi:hypothetical protein